MSMPWHATLVAPTGLHVSGTVHYCSQTQRVDNRRVRSEQNACQCRKEAVFSRALGPLSSFLTSAHKQGTAAAHEHQRPRSVDCSGNTSQQDRSTHGARSIVSPSETAVSKSGQRGASFPLLEHAARTRSQVSAGVTRAWCKQSVLQTRRARQLGGRTQDDGELSPAVVSCR